MILYLNENRNFMFKSKEVSLLIDARVLIRETEKKKKIRNKKSEIAVNFTLELYFCNEM